MSIGAHHGVEPLLGDQRDRGAAEPAAGHPGAERARLDRGRATAVSSSAQEISKSSRIEACEAANSGPSAVPGARPRRPSTTSVTRAISVTTCRARFRSRSSSSASTWSSVGLPQRRHPEPRGRGLAVVAPLAVAAVGQVVGDPGVGHQQGEAGVGQGQGHVGGRVGVEVDQQRRPGRRVQRDRLVHAAGRRARHLGLGADAGLHQPLPAVVGQLGPQQAADRGRDGALDGRGAREPGAERDRAVDGQLHAREVEAVLDGAPTARPATYAAQSVTSPGPSRSTWPVQPLADCRLITCTRPSARRAPAAYVAWGRATGRHRPAL